MAEGIVLESRSWEKGGEEARDKHLKAVVEGAGHEIAKEDEAELPAPPADLNENVGLRESIEKSREAYFSRVEKTKQDYADWDTLQKKFEANDVEIGQPVQVAIYEQENGPAITHYLMRNPDYARKLGRLCRAGRGVTAANEIQKLSPKLEANIHTRTPQRRRPSENANHQEIAKAPNYPGKARHFRRALERER